VTDAAGRAALDLVAHLDDLDSARVAVLARILADECRARAAWPSRTRPHGRRGGRRGGQDMAAA
jgi:hypothetical protein